VGEADFFSHTLHARLDELEFLRVPKTQLIQPLGLGLADVARGVGLGLGYASSW